MRILETNICVGLGDLICMKGQTEPFRNEFDEMRISFDQNTLNIYRKNDHGYMKFLDEMGQLFFSEPPYILNAGQYPIRGQQGLCKQYNLPLVKPNLKHILCKGSVLNLDEEYIVITTKLRTFPRHNWMNISGRLWHTMHRLSEKYKIVILGEKKVEMSKEYTAYGSNMVYGVYNEIVQHLPKHRILDLTIPALGITSPTVKNIQQDCLIMSEAKFVVMVGIGGAFCMSTAVANVIGYRVDNDGLAAELYDNREYPDAFITKNFDAFINRLEKQL